MINIKLPTVETERLILREIMVKDAADMFEYASDKENCFYRSSPLHQTIEDTVNVINEKYLKRPSKGIPIGYAITLKDNGKMIGVVDVDSVIYNDIGEVGFTINKEYWGKGFAKEACEKLIEVCFNELGLRKILARHNILNIGSQRVIEKLGFVYEGRMRKLLADRDGIYSDHLFYSILKEEYKSKGESDEKRIST